QVLADEERPFLAVRVFDHTRCPLTKSRIDPLYPQIGWFTHMRIGINNFHGFPSLMERNSVRASLTTLWAACFYSGALALSASAGGSLGLCGDVQRSLAVHVDDLLIVVLILAPVRFVPPVHLLRQPVVDLLRIQQQGSWRDLDPKHPAAVHQYD